MTFRDNQTWVDHLSRPGPEREAALADLRGVLVRGLRGATAGRGEAAEGVIEDAAQEALMNILASLDKFRGESRFTTWATAVSVRVAMTELRRRRWLDKSLQDVAGELDFSPPEAAASSRPELKPRREEILEKVRDLIRRELTDRQRTALVAELNDMPQEEIARRTGSSRNAVYKLVHDARKRLRHGLEAAGFSAVEVGEVFNI